MTAFVAGCLDYCNAVLYGAAKTTIQQLQAVMNVAVRLNCWWTWQVWSRYAGSTRHASRTAWLPIQQRIEFKVAVLAFDCVRGTCPSYFCDICTRLTEVGGRVRHRSAHRGDLCVPSTRTEFSKRSFRVAAPRTWNSLTLHLRSPTIRRQQFQSGLKTHLFKRAYKWLLPPRTIEEWTYLLTYLFTYLLCHMKIGPISKLSYVRFLPEVNCQSVPLCKTPFDIPK